MSRNRQSTLARRVAGSVLALLLPAAAVAIELRLDHSPTINRSTVHAVGSAVDGCPPALASAAVDGRQVVLRALSSDATCLDAAQPFALSSAPLALDRDAVYRVRFELQVDPQSSPWLEAFALLPGAGSPAAVIPESGFWWGEAGGEFDHTATGFGVLVEVQGRTVAVSVSGYDEHGNPEWLMGAAPLQGRVTSIPLGRLEGGRGPHGDTRAPNGMRDAGRLHVEWLGSARAVFWFERPAASGFGIELTPVSMVRFGFYGDRGEHWLGRWLLAAERDFDGAPAPRAIDFVTVTATGNGFVLLGHADERLECQVDRERPNSPPDACRLQAGELDVSFADVALRRLQGTAGAPLSLIRLDR